MQTDIQKKLDLLYQKLAARHFETFNHSIENIIPHFLQILDAISVNYITYRKYIPTLLSILEKTNSSSIVLLISTYLDFHSYLIKKKPLTKFELSDINEDHPDTLPEKFKLALEKSLHKNQKIRISDFHFASSSLNDSEKDELISILLDLVESSVVKKVHWDKNTVNDVMFYLPILRSLLKERENIKAFHFICGSVMDSFAHSEFYQQSRDLAEELLMTSYIDNNSHLGYLNSFRCYSNTSSLIPALLYANLSFSVAIKNAHSLTDKYIKEIIWQGIKFFRNVSFHKYVKDIYESIPEHISFHYYEECGIAHSYFLSLLMINPKETPSLVLDFLNKNREKIYDGGHVEAMPWLITLYNIQRICSNADFSSPGGLGMYLKTFEYIVPKEMVSTRKAMIEGDSIKLKPLLRNSLISLNETRNVSDLENDNKIAIQMASRLIEDAIKKEDYEGLLLAMMVKADFSFIFSEKEKAEVSQFNIPSKDIESFNRIYGDGSEIMTRLKLLNDFEFIWILNSEKKLFQFYLHNSQFKSLELTNWSYDNFKELIDTKFFSTFYFEDTIKTKREVRVKYSEEHEEQSNLLKERFAFMNIESSSSKPILYVLDNRIAVFPHNLYLNTNGNFIYLNRPTCNILSTEWYMKYSNQVKLSKNYSKAIWIPIEGGDFTINQLYSRLEDYFSDFSVSKSVIPEAPISSELNIITAHGAENIAIKHALYPDSTHLPQINFKSFLGKGKILILFVCHSGSIKNTPFKNSISSIAKKFITKGYQAVIAPFWALHINIAPIWLPVFLKSIEEGNILVEAVHNANMAVHKTFPTICASHCMHLFGDPHLTIEN